MTLSELDELLNEYKWMMPVIISVIFIILPTLVYLFILRRSLKTEKKLIKKIEEGEVAIRFTDDKIK